MRQLPRNQQEALALCVWSGVPYPEAAQVLGITESSRRQAASPAETTTETTTEAPGETTETRTETTVEGVAPDEAAAIVQGCAASAGLSGNFTLTQLVTDEAGR